MHPKQKGWSLVRRPYIVKSHPGVAPLRLNIPPFGSRTPRLASTARSQASLTAVLLETSSRALYMVPRLSGGERRLEGVCLGHIHDRSVFMLDFPGT